MNTLTPEQEAKLARLYKRQYRICTSPHPDDPEDPPFSHETADFFARAAVAEKREEFLKSNAKRGRKA